MNLDTKGRVTGSRPKPGPWLGFFALAALKTAAGYEFDPCKIDGEPIESKFEPVLNYRPGNIVRTGVVYELRPIRSTRDMMQSLRLRPPRCKI